MEDEFFKEERSYEFGRIKQTVRYRRISAHAWLENPNIPPAVQAIVGMSLEEKNGLLKRLIPKEYIDFSTEVNKFIGNLSQEEIEKK